jgi:hypothetical protein
MSVRHIPRDLSRFVRHRLLRLPKRTYWEGRKNARYLNEVRRLVDEHGADAASILDVGSNGCPYLDWFGWIPRRVSIDLANPYADPGIESIRADFLEWETAERFDVVLCLQVLEHIPDAQAFARRLLAMTRRHLIVSVPYKWPAGRVAEHVHDPVDEAKVDAWFGRLSTTSTVVRERTGKARLVRWYDCRTGAPA